MQTGKLTPQQLHDHILSKRGKKRPEILVSAEMGEDSAVVDFSGRYAVFSTDPITGAMDRAGWLAIHVAANDIFSNGAEPIGCLLTILAPPQAELTEIDRVMSEAAQAATELDMEICGGHTEITDAVNRIVLSTTVFGSLSENKVIRSSNACAGDAIVVSKHLGLEGSAILARDYATHLQSFFSDSELTELAEMISLISVGTESRIAVQHAAHALHDITEGGLLGALYEMAEAAGLGFRIDGQVMPLHPLTRKLCDALAIDSLRFLSSGSLLIATPDGEALVAALQSKGIMATVIGHFTSDIERVLNRQGLCETVQPPQGDALWQAIERIQGSRL